MVHTVVRGGFHCLSYLLFLTGHLQAEVGKENAQGMTALCLAAHLDQHMLTEVGGSTAALPLVLIVCAHTCVPAVYATDTTELNVIVTSCCTPVVVCEQK